MMVMMVGPESFGWKPQLQEQRKSPCSIWHLNLRLSSFTFESMRFRKIWFRTRVHGKMAEPSSNGMISMVYTMSFINPSIPHSSTRWTNRIHLFSNVRIKERFRVFASKIWAVKEPMNYGNWYYSLSGKDIFGVSPARFWFLAGWYGLWPYAGKTKNPRGGAGFSQEWCLSQWG